VPVFLGGPSEIKIREDLGKIQKGALGNREYKVITEKRSKIQGKDPERMQEST